MNRQELLKSARQRNSFALWLTSAMALTFGWLYAGPQGAFLGLSAWMLLVVIPRATGMHPLGFIYRGFFSAEQLPLTMVNLVLAILCGCMIWGIDVAFYAALIGVPIVVLTLTIVALDLAPDADSALEANSAP